MGAYVGGFPNQTDLEDYVNKNPKNILFEAHSNSETITYTPTEIVKVTLVFGNPNQDNITLTFNAIVDNALFPALNLQQLSTVLIPIGIVLSAPIVYNYQKNRKLKKITP